MALDNEDIEKIGMILALKLHEAMEPLHDSIQRHTFQISGADGGNGLCGDMKQVKRDISDVKSDIMKFKSYAVAISGFISTTIGVAWEVGSKLLGKH